MEKIISLSRRIKTPHIRHFGTISRVPVQPYSKYVPIRINVKKTYDDYKSWGMLTSIDIHKCDPDLIRSETSLKSYVNDLCNAIKMKKYGDTHVVNFGANDEVEGYSVFQFIETSCISGHLANKTNSAYWDIFSCSSYDPKSITEFTAAWFRGKEYSYNVLLRGTQ